MSDRAKTAARAGALTVGDLLDEIAAALGAGGIPDARDEARDIVAIAMQRPRLWPTAHGNDAVTTAQREWSRSAAARRRRGAPFAYAVGQSAFRSLTLAVDQRVLIPRQETEELVQLVLDRTGRTSGGTAVDVGTGSGAIALALAAEGTFDVVVATDISVDALAVARGNLAALPPDRASRMRFVAGAGLGALAGLRARAIVANPPYISVGEMSALPAAVRDWEPAIALYGGADGLDPYRALSRDAAGRLEPGGLIALEVDARRASLVAEMFATDRRYANVAVHLDLSGRERFVTAVAAGD